MDQQGEQSMSPQDLQELVPDLVSPKGQAKVQSLIDQAQKVQPELDNQLRLVAMQSGLDPVQDFESRIKNPDTIIKKVAVHRQAGKDGYRANDVNDLYGARFIADTPDQKAKVIDAIHKLDENNWTKIDKEEQVDHGTYHAYHMDINKKGVKAEIQIHDPHSLFESVMNHEIRAQHGENPPAPLEQVKQQATQIGYKLPADTAQAIAQKVQAQRAMQQKAPKSLLNAKPIMTKDDVQTIGKFAELVETGKGRNNMGTLGQTIQSLTENLFGKQAATWSNTQVKNALDIYLQNYFK